MVYFDGLRTWVEWLARRSSSLNPAIRSMGHAHGHPIQMGTVWVVMYAHGCDPWVTQLVVGSIWT